MNYVEDFRRVFLHLTEKYKDSDFYGIGHSFGANTLTRYLGICGSNKISSGFKACVSISNPYDFQVGIRLLDPLSNNYIRFHRQKIVKL
jgi:predicted alpha/beta-fold hydrolase